MTDLIPILVVAVLGALFIRSFVLDDPDPSPQACQDFAESLEPPDDGSLVSMGPVTILPPLTRASVCRCGSCGAPLEAERCAYCGTRHEVERERPVRTYMGGWQWEEVKIVSAYALAGNTDAGVTYDEDYYFEGTQEAPPR